MVIHTDQQSSLENLLDLRVFDSRWTLPLASLPGVYSQVHLDRQVMNGLAIRSAFVVVEFECRACRWQRIRLIG